MKIYSKTYLFIVLASLSCEGIKAMEKPSAGPTLYKTKDLVIENDYLDQLGVAYIRNDRPGVPIKFRMQPGERSLIPDVNSLKDLRFNAYGRYKGLLNFTDSPNYRTKYNFPVWEETPWPAILYVNVKGAPVPEAKTASTPISSEPAEWKGWGALTWQLGTGAWQKTKEMSSYAAQQATEQIMPRITAFQVTPRIEKKVPEKYVPEAFEGKTFQGKPLYELFPSANVRIIKHGYFFGRDVLGLGEDYTVLDANEARKLLKTKWTDRRALYSQDPIAVPVIDNVLKLIEEAGDDPRKTFPKERLGVD